ncbi:MAG: chemotaxis response regulator protein-glutamate methylesterase [Gammaproteobacteria bacterium]
MNDKKIKVLVVDDSALIRQLLTEILNSDRNIKVVGTAQDPYRARDKIKELRPDVLTLDVEMPRMDGLTFLRNLMRLHPMPVVMISSLTERGADITLQALEIGAVDFVSKPKIDVAHSLADYSQDIIAKVRVAAGARIRTGLEESLALKSVAPKLTADAVLKRNNRPQPFKTTDKIIAIGASTGGTEAIKEVLLRLPADAPGVVISQHIPEAFSTPFAARMNSVSAMTVCEASDGQQILPGHVYIAPGSHHMLVERSGARYICRLNEGPPVNRHRPSVDVMFRSVAQNVAANALGILLTGMGDDGARGLKEMHDAGAATIVQDEKTSIVWGMPGEAVKLGCVDSVLPLEKIAGHIITLLRKAAA